MPAVKVAQIIQHVAAKGFIVVDHIKKGESHLNLSVYHLHFVELQRQTKVIHPPHLNAELSMLVGAIRLIRIHPTVTPVQFVLLIEEEIQATLIKTKMVRL